MSEISKFYCENGCGFSITTAMLEQINEEIVEIKLKINCPYCDEVTEFIEDLTVTTTFKCADCDHEKEASINPTEERAITKNPCPKCGKVTEWREVGWERINLE